MIDYLRFLMSPADRDRIDPASITANATTFDPPPGSATAPWPESLQLNFTIRDPGNGAPRLRPIFPGDLTFLPDPVGPGITIPQPADVRLDAAIRVIQAAYDGWSDVGQIRIDVGDSGVAKDLGRDVPVPGIGSAPSIAWYGPVLVTLDFLNDALLHGLQRRGILIDPAQNLLPTADPAWPAQAVSRFYQSTYRAPLGIHKPPAGQPVDRDQDDVVRLPMPRLVMDQASGAVRLVITLAKRRSNAEISDFSLGNPLALPETHPGHPNFDVIPTRLFLHVSRPHLIGGDTGNTVADAIIGTNTFLRDLKSNLTTLGFGNLGPADNSFARRTQWAVREFQIYSKMPNVAHLANPALGEPALQMVQQVNNLRYEGPISGFFNSETRRRIDFWARNDYRCPVVVTARTGAGFLAVAPGGQRLWAHDDMNSEAPRVYVRDVSDYYALPAQDGRDISVSGERFIILGTFESDGLSGPNMLPAHSWSNMGIDGGRTTGVAENVMAVNAAHAALWSTYKTILPTAHEEAFGRFDVCNGWDDQTMSIPLFHYTFTAGELGALLAYLRYRDANLFEQAIGFFGLRPSRTWPNTTRFQGKHTSTLSVIRTPEATYSDVPANQADRDYFKTWHWFYRFVMAYRIFDNWKRITYDFARRRIQDIRAVPMTHKPANNPATIPHDAAGAEVRISDVFTSELAMGMILRWHVKFPAHIVDGAGANPHAAASLWNAFRRAQDPAQNGGINVNWGDAAGTWGDDHESAIIAGLIAHAPHVSASMQAAFNDIQNFQIQGQNLSRTRASLIFATPPA